MEAVKQLLQSTEPVKWLFYGDSITHGALHTFGERDYAELFAERLRYELARTMDVVITTAISGDNSRGLLSGFDWRVAQFTPDVVFVMIGMNDCSDGNDITVDEFADNLVQLARRIADLGGVTVLQTTCPILPGQAPDRAPHIDAYMDTIRQVATDEALPLIDHTRYWLEHADSHNYWMSDAFHPNNLGHRAFARLLYQELGIWDENSPSCRLFVP